MCNKVDNPEIAWFSSGYMSCEKEKDQVLDTVPKEIEFHAFGMENSYIGSHVYISKIKVYN